MEWSKGLFSKSNLYPLITRSRPSTHGRMGRSSWLALHPDFSDTFVRLEPEKLIRPTAVTQLHRLVVHKPVRERLQEWIRIHPGGWRQVVDLLERRPDYVPVFCSMYEHLRLTYIRTTGDLDVTLGSIEDDISRGNVVLETQLEESYAATEAEMQMRKNRLDQFRALQAQGPHICRRDWSHIIQSTTTRPVHYVPRDRPLVLGKRKRGGDPAEAGKGGGNRAPLQARPLRLFGRGGGGRPRRQVGAYPHLGSQGAGGVDRVAATIPARRLYLGHRPPTQKSIWRLIFVRRTRTSKSDFNLAQEESYNIYAFFLVRR